jgi:hypothetical protein
VSAVNLRAHKKAIRRTIILVVVLALVASLVFSLRGCLFGPDSWFFPLKGVSQQDIENYLTQKYGDIHYKVTDFGGGMRWSGYNELKAKITDGEFKGDTFDAKVVENDDGSVSYQDNYYGFLIQPQYEAMIKQVADKYFKNCIALVAFEDFPASVGPSTTLEQTMQSGQMAHNYVYIYTYDGNPAQNGQCNKTLIDQQTAAFAKTWNAISNRSLVETDVVSKKIFDRLIKNPGYEDEISSKNLIIYEKAVNLNDWLTNPVPGVK